MMNSWDKEDELESFIREYNTSPFVTDGGKKKKGKKMVRSVRYVAPGVTEVTYPNRILTYKFKQSQEEYDRAKHMRKVRSGRKGGKAPHAMRRSKYTDSNGMPFYVREQNERVRNEQAAKDAQRMDTGDMRALLKDEHWEEVCGHKRWMYDNKALVKEYTKYVQSRKGRY